MDFFNEMIADSSIELHAPWGYFFTMDPREEAGRRLKLARDAKGWTLREVCDRVPGLTQTRLHNWEAGKRMLPVDMAKQIAVALGTSAAWLLTIEDAPPTPRETALLQYFREADSRGKDTIIRTAESQSAYLTPAPGPLAGNGHEDR